MSLLRRMANALPDRMYISLQFKRIMGRFPNLKHPKTFNEKLQWLKLNDRKDLYTKLADKYAVRDYVKEILGEDYLVPLYGVWNRAEEIQWDELPERFVLKCTHDGGSVIVCRNKAAFDQEVAMKKLNGALKRSAYSYGREWPYKNIVPHIIAEQYLDNGDDAGLVDYKFYCFGGEPRYLYVSKGLENHATATITFYELNGKRAPFQRTDYPQTEEDHVFPENYSEMIEYARKIAKKVNNSFVRVDLYNVKGHVYFSEITFTPCSGYMKMKPEEWDRKLGDLVVLPFETK